MALLPDDTALGPLPSADSGRPIATYDTSAIGAGISNLGKGIQSGAEDAVKVAVDGQKKLDDLDVAKANSDYLIKTAQIRDDMSDETDPTALAGNYVPKFQQAQADSAALITSPRARELWSLKTAPVTNDHIIAVGDQQFKLETANGIADAQGQLDDLRNSALKTSDPTQRAKFIQTGQQLIGGLQDAGYIDAVTAQKYRTQWTQDYAVGAVKLMSPQDQVKALSPTVQGRDAILDRIGGAENATGNPAARNPTSSAMGNFQFTDKTWLDTVQAHRPDLLQGRDPKDVLALRADPKISREMAGYLLDDNSAVLRSQGIPPTPSNLYLAHFLGASDAAKVLNAPSGTPISDIVSPDSIAANKSVLQGKTVDTVAQWASSKMGGSPPGKGDLIDFIPEDQRVTMLQTANEQVAAQGIDGKRRTQLEQQQIKDTSDNREIEVMKDLYSDNPTTTAQSITTDPKLTREAIERLLPKAHAAMENANSKADKTYGNGFYDAYQMVHAPEGTPGRITDPTQLYSRVGPKGDLTVAGVNKLVAEIQGRKTPEGVADAEMQKQFLATAKAKISGQDEGLHIKDPKGEQLYLKFMAYALPAIDAGKKAGKSSAQLLNPDSPDYVGKVLNTPGNGFVRPMDQWFSDVMGGSDVHNGTATPAAFDPKTVKSLDDLVTAYKSGKVSQAVASQTAIDNGWAAKSASTNAPAPPLSGDNSAQPNLLEQARAQYPILKKQDYGYTENFKPNSGFLEHWDPGEEGSPASPDKPLDGMRPKDLPIDQHGLEIRDPKTRPIDILGDIVSHNLVHSDPVVKAAYEKLEGSLTQKQQGILQDQYEYAQKNEGETRSFADWKNISGMPGFFRGYTFKQWPKEFNDKAYTPAQRADLDKLMEYLSKGGSK